VLRLGALARLARSHVLGDINVLAHPKGEAAHQRPRLGPPEVSPERAIVALAKNLRAQPAAGGDAEAVRLTLPAAVQEAATHQECPALRSAGGLDDGGTNPVHELAERRRRAAPKTASTVSSAAKAVTNVGERKKSFEGTGGDGAVVVPVPSASSAPASATNTL